VLLSCLFACVGGGETPIAFAQRLIEASKFCTMESIMVGDLLICGGC